VSRDAGDEAGLGVGSAASIVTLVMVVFVMVDKVIFGRGVMSTLKNHKNKSRSKFWRQKVLIGHCVLLAQGSALYPHL